MTGRKIPGTELMFIAHRHMLNASELAAVTRLFSSSLLQEMARKGRSQLFGRLAKEAGLTRVLSGDNSIGELFDVAFSLLSRREYRNEYVYKAAIAHKVLMGVHNLDTASMLTEFRVGGCKADIAILNGTSTAYEIKSERDRLDRLQSQVDAYRKVFAKVNIITGENHLGSVLGAVPEDVGVMLLTRRHQISTVRESINTPSRIVPEVVFDALQLREARQILKRLKVDAPDVPNTRMHFEMGRRFASLDPGELHAAMVEVLKRTRSQKRLQGVVESLPRSLHAAVLSSPLRKSDHANLQAVVGLPIREALSWT